MYKKGENEILDFILNNIEKVDFSDADTTDNEMSKRYLDKNGDDYLCVNVAFEEDDTLRVQIFSSDIPNNSDNRSLDIHIKYKDYPKTFDYLSSIHREKTDKLLNFLIDNTPGLKREININKL